MTFMRRIFGKNWNRGGAPSIEIEIHNIANFFTFKGNFFQISGVTFRVFFHFYKKIKNQRIPLYFNCDISIAKLRY